eukprot:TRINITY_DN103535_c0_g1_i1.p1 TRINITY_DN103535_c0_g1~~TRINITY_DN103535_c0_g1_i1.p1  ORF type:complete len:405 (-),score=95.85 TRINITY_DN103535_c0_g1_i1:288-1406(-)
MPECSGGSYSSDAASPPSPEERRLAEENAELWRQLKALQAASEEASRSRAKRSLRRLFKATRDFVLPAEVPRLPASSLTPLEFFRDWVSTKQPVVLTDLDEDAWPCLRRWTDDYLLSKVGDSEISVNVTPHGYGDFVDKDGRFVKPVEQRMKFRDFLSNLRKGGSATDGVPYVSQQNDSLRQELPALLEDVPDCIKLAAEAFENEPDAINLWIGDERSVSTCHLDHYENMYTVVRGEKIFTLLPPSAAPFLDERLCPAARFSRSGDGSGFDTVLDEPREEVRWIAQDVGRLAAAALASESEAEPWAPFVQVHVRPGEMLYLPAMWYHHVQQRGITIAVNYWHDMQFGHGWVAHQFLRDVTGLNDDDDDGDED